VVRRCRFTLGDDRIMSAAQALQGSRMPQFVACSQVLPIGGLSFISTPHTMRCAQYKLREVAMVVDMKVG